MNQDYSKMLQSKHTKHNFNIQDNQYNLEQDVRNNSSTYSQEFTANNCEIAILYTM